MRVVIAGLGKSGTTALVYAVAAAMPPGTRVLFEPREYVEVPAGHVAAKVVLHPRFPLEHRFFRQFDHVVLLARDPRDLLVSKALYRIFGGKVHADQAKVDRYLELLRAKEQDPRSVSLLDINRAYQGFVGPTLHSDEGLTRILTDAMAFHDAFPDALLFHYEDMVAGRFDAVAGFLGLAAAAMKPVIPPGLQRVVRTRRAGNWRDWFCPEDVTHYRPLVAAYMARYGYADDWTLAPAPSIRPEECSGYVMRLVREPRGQVAAAGR